MGPREGVVFAVFRLFAPSPGPTDGGDVEGGSRQRDSTRPDPTRHGVGWKVDRGRSKAVFVKY